MSSRLSRLNIAMGSDACFVTVGPAKVKTCEYILFTEDIPKVEIMGD